MDGTLKMSCQLTNSLYYYTKKYFEIFIEIIGRPKVAKT